MKRLKYLLIALILIIPINGKAAFHCSAPSSVESGETFGVTFYGSIGGPAPVWRGKIGSDGNASFSSGSLTIEEWDGISNFSRTVYFTAGNPGSASFYVYDVDVASDTESFDGSDTCTVSITEATAPNGGDNSNYNNDDDDDEDEVDPDKSAINALKSLSIDGVKLSPAFNKDRLEYTAVVAGDKDKINITGEVEDDKATVDGLGEKELKEGINRFEIVVTAENGQTRKYIINVTRKEKNPIEVIINKKKYTIIKKDITLKVPEGFTKTTIKISKQEVEAYTNNYTGYVLVALVDEQGNAGWFIYNDKNGTYTKYSEFRSSGLRLVILKANKKDIPYKYKECKIKINEETVDGYALELGSSYRLVYALNMETGNKGFYLYDMEENTFQRFYNSQVNIYRKLVKKFEVALIAIAGVFLLMFIIIVSQFVINKKTKKFIKNGGKKEEYKPVIEDEDLDDEKEKEKEKLKKIVKEKNNKVNEEKLSKTMNKEPIKEETKKIDLEDKPLTREEIKRRKREEKIAMEEARRDFFDL